MNQAGTPWLKQSGATLSAVTKGTDMSKDLSVLVMAMMIWDERGKLDEAGFRKHLGRIRDGGASVFLGSSASGDGFAMSPEEWDRALAIAAEELKGRTGFRVMGYEPRSLEEVQRFVRLVEPHKPDALQIYALDLGHSVYPTKAELEIYYETILGGTDLNIVLSFFDTLGAQLHLDLIEKLAAKYGNLVGFVYSGRDPFLLTDVAMRLRDRLILHTAGPWNLLALLTLGGNGYMGFEGNICPELVSGVVDAFGAGDMEKLKSSYEKLIRLSGLHRPYSGSSGRAVKPMLNKLGLPGGFLRPPRLPVAPDIVEKLTQETLKLDLPNFPKRTVEGR